MPRIFVCLAIGNLIVLVATGVLGLLHLEDFSYHIVLAVFTLLVTCVVQVLAFTYFTVSGKVIAQAVHLAKLDVTPLTRMARRKRRNTHALAAVIVAVVLVTASGASYWRGGVPVYWHEAGAALIVMVVALSFVRQYTLVVENNEDLERVMAEYSSRRGADGQPTVHRG